MRPQPKPMRTWILVADGNGARILEALGEGSGFHQVSGGEVLSDGAPSDFKDRGNTAASRRNIARALETLFASQLAAMLAGYLRQSAFDRLIIVAPPTMLTELRKMIGPNVREKIIAEIAKDLTKIPNNEISVHLDGVVVL